MARFIIANKVYDTDKMEFIGYVLKWYKFNGWLMRQIFGEDMGRDYDCELYRSQKGSWLITHESDTGLCGEAITEEVAKNLLKTYDYDKYAEIFGGLEEA